MLCHGHIFLLSHSNKNIITSPNINKLSFLCDTKKLISIFLYHHFFLFSFYITHCQHVDLLRSSPGNKETFNHLLLTCLIYTEQLPSKSFSWNKVSYYLQSVSQYFDTLRCFTKLSFHDKWNDGQLLRINMVYTSCLTSCRTT